MAAEETFVGDSHVKRPREEENGVSATVDVEAAAGVAINSDVPSSISSVIPGWFSEISPMWPGPFSLCFLLHRYLLLFCRHLGSVGFDCVLPIIAGNVDLLSRSLLWSYVFVWVLIEWDNSRLLIHYGHALLTDLV